MIIHHVVRNEAINSSTGWVVFNIAGNMDDFQTINDIVNESVRNSSYYTVAISSTVFIAYTLIVKLVDYFKARSKNKPLIEMSRAMKEMTENIAKLNAVLDKTFKEAERKELQKCKNVIELSFRVFASRVSEECESVIIHNNIEKNRDLIIDNINKVVSTEYFKLYSILSAYEVNEINVASKLKEDWIKEIADSVIAMVYNGQDAITRITQINNKLLIYIGTYSTYINAKTFNT